MKKGKAVARTANRSASNLLSNRTKSYQKYVKDSTRRRGQHAIDEHTPGSTFSSRMKSRVFQNPEKGRITAGTSKYQYHSPHISIALESMNNDLSPPSKHKKARRYQPSANIGNFIDAHNS